MAIFSLFAKDQIGGEREILTQQIFLRMSLSLVEEFFASLGSLFSEDMVSIKNKVLHQINLENDIKKMGNMVESFNFFISYNTDTSKYSPSFLMSSFMYLLVAMNLPKQIEELMMSITRAFGAKICCLPVSMQRKFMEDYVTNMTEMEYLKENTTKSPQAS